MNKEFLTKTNTDSFESVFVCAMSYLPGRHQPSIVTVNELNYCVRNGNRCTLVTIITHLLSCEQEKVSKENLPARYARSCSKETYIYEKRFSR